MKTLSLSKHKKLSKSQLKRNKKKEALKKAIFNKSEMIRTQILSDEYLQSFDVISNNNLLTLGFSKEIKFVYDQTPELFCFSKHQLARSLSAHCESELYQAIDKYGVRYNVDNKPTHQIVMVINNG